MGMYYEGAERSIDCAGISGREGRWDELSMLPGGVLRDFFAEMKSEKPQQNFSRIMHPAIGVNPR